jgi:hypothetical protein
MRRRTVLQSALGAAGLASIPAWAQGTFPGAHEKSLKELAAVVLPESLGRKATDEIADRFIRWVHGYQPGAEMAPGYGNTRMQRKPAAPAAAYLEQLDQLSLVLTSATRTEKRRAIAESIKAAGVRDLGNYPSGAHIAADLMTFWFQSPEANDLAYDAAVGKDQCRGIADSAQQPRLLRKEPLRKGGARRAAL